MFGIGIAIFSVVMAAAWFAPKFKRAAFAETEPEADLPCAFGYKMAWIAVRTRDTARLIETLRLRDARSASWAIGVRTIYSERAALDRVFVTPPVDGWSFVAGLALPYPMGDGFDDKCTPLLVDLSREFGQVQYYVSCPTLQFFGWARLSDGQLMRAFAGGREGVVWNRGAMTTDERDIDLPSFQLRAVGSADGDRPRMIGEDDVIALARRWSLDPTQLDAIEGMQVGIGYVAAAPADWRVEVAAQQAA